MRKSQPVRCPVAKLAAEYGELTRRHEALDRIIYKSQTIELAKQNRAKLEQDHLNDRRSAIREAASFMVPSSAEGAAFLVIQSFNLSGDETDEHGHRTLARYHYALLRYFVASGTNVAPEVLNYDMPQYMDPLQ